MNNKNQNIVEMIQNDELDNRDKQRRICRLLVKANNSVLFRFFDSVRYDFKQNVFVVTTLMNKIYRFQLCFDEVVTVKSGNQKLVVEQLKINELYSWFSKFIMAIHGDTTKYSSEQLERLFEKKSGF